jgi:predicted NBD/HSP70 family sugar kinase
VKLRGDQSTSRAINRRLILNLLRANGPMSRAELATISHLSAATVTFVVSDLIAEQVLLEGATSPGAPGRRPIPIEINYAGRLAVGLKFNVGSISGVLTDLSTTPVAAITVPVVGLSPDAYIEASVLAVEELLRHAKKTRGSVTGIGIGMPGIIDISTGTCARSYRLAWTAVPIATMLAERVHLPVWVDDDTNAFALAQLLFGLARSHRTVGVLAIGAGIGCAVVVDGAVHHGASGAAGKLGHTIHDPNGPMCLCGRRGCLGAHYSEPALVKRWRGQGERGRDITRFDMTEAADRGDESAIAILREAGDNIGRHLATFCNIVDPEIVVVGGEAVAFGDHLFGPMRLSLEAHTFASAPPVLPDWQHDSWERGAAALATQQLFDFEAVSGRVKAA